MTARVVPPEEADRIKAGAKLAPSDSTARLLSGEMLHFDDERVHFSASRLKTQHQVRLRTESDGAGGRYYWVEPPGHPDD